MPISRARTLALLAWCLGGLAWPTHGALAQECPDGRISDIIVDSKSIFDMSQIGEGRSFRWAYNLANSLHFRTREEFLEAELLVHVGDCADPFLIQESARILRQYDFLARVDVYPVPQADGSQHLIVDTQDEWTTQFDVRFRFETGVDFEGLSLTEKNLLGRGIILGGFWLRRREARAVGGTLALPRTFGTRLNTGLSVGETRVGTFVVQNFSYPFVGERGRWSATEVYFRNENLFAYSLENHPLFSHVVLPIEQERAEITVSRRFGPAGDLTFLGLGLSREILRFPDAATRVEVVTERDFANRDPAPQDLTDRALELARETRATRINLVLGKRNVRFRPMARLDALKGVQDIPTGTEVSLALGRSLGFLASDNPAEVDDLFARVQLFGGATPGPWVLAAGASLEGRRISDDEPTGPTGWRDVLGEADLYSYWRPSQSSSHTVFARISAASGWKLDSPLQLTLGGAEQLRGIRFDRYPGGRRLVATVEDRVALAWTAGDLLDFGMTVFADLGRTWRGDVPFGTDSGWQTSVGAGLRIGFPKGTRGVARIDLAVPASGPDAFGSPVLRITALEFLGLSWGLRDAQLERSRRTPVASTILPGLAGG